MPDDIVRSNGSQDDNDTADQPTHRVGRRKMLLGVAAAGVGASVVAGVEPAGATDGNPVLLGESNKASAATIITNKKGVALAGFTSDSGQAGVLGGDTSTDGAYGLYGLSDNGTGVYGSITGDTSGQSAIEGVDGSSGGGYGVQGTSENGVGVVGYTSATGQYGVQGVDNSQYGGYGVYGTSISGTSIYGSRGGQFEFGNAVQGDAANESGIGVRGDATGSSGVGVYGSATGSGENSIGVYAYSENSVALYADGNAGVLGNLTKGGGSFKIDHPVDPANKYLYHSFVESPDMKNVYDGTVTLDGDGRATVELPGWFEALNRDYRYQLTAVGSPAPELHISRVVNDGKFSIAGGTAEQKVSWQVTGIRQDVWANANRIPVEVDKMDEDRGRFLHPDLFGGEAILALAKARDSGRRHLNNPTI
ncbi:MAG: hypothetical protein WAM97_04120 [Acidimicrobiales bacterium]